MWKEGVVALSRDEVGYCDICLERQRKATTNFSQESPSPVLGHKLNFPSTKGSSYRSVCDGDIHVDRLDRESEGVMELYISGTPRD